MLPGTVRVLTTGPAASRPHSWPRLSPPVTDASDGLPGATGGRYEKCPIVAAPVALHTQRRSRVPPPLTSERRQPSSASARTPNLSSRRCGRQVPDGATTAPQLQPPVMGVWVCPTHRTKGVYWDGSGWRVVVVRPERA